MNMHVPQSLQTAVSFFILPVPYQIISAKHKPVISLVQDSYKVLVKLQMTGLFKFENDDILIYLIILVAIFITNTTNPEKWWRATSMAFSPS